MGKFSFDVNIFRKKWEEKSPTILSDCRVNTMKNSFGCTHLSTTPSFTSKDTGSR